VFDLKPADQLDHTINRLTYALDIASRRINNKRKKHGFGPEITRIELLHGPVSLDDRTIFEVGVRHDDFHRNIKLLFQPTNKRRKSVVQYRGKRDLTEMTIFIRVRDCFSQILTRISKRIGLVISDIRRQIDFWKKVGHGRSMPPKFTRKWRQRRRHVCHRQRFCPPMMSC